MSNSSRFPYRTVYDLLDAARERPAMFGIGGKSYRLLRTFLAGLSFGNLDPGSPSAWDFPSWGAVILGDATTSFPLRELEQECTDEDAYDAYFRLLDEYRRCREVELARVPGSILRPRFRVLDEQFREQMPPIAESLFISQFAPSEVYFLGEVYHDRVSRCCPYFHSAIDDAIEEAKKRWDVEPGAWPL